MSLLSFSATLGLSRAMHDIDLAPRAGDRPVRDPDLEEVVASPDARFVVLMDEYVVARPGEDPPEAVAYGLYALTGLAAYPDGIVQSPPLASKRRKYTTSNEMYLGEAGMSSIGGRGNLR